MRTYSLTHLSDRDLLGRLAALVARDRVTTAELLAHISEVDARKLYLPAACPSMLVYCVRELHLSEGSALKRIHAARAAREFPEIFAALAEGRLHLSAVVQLAPHLTQENADGLFSAAAWKTKSEIQKLLAERFPRTELLPLVEAVPTTNSQLAPGRLETSAPKTAVEPSELAPGRLETPRAKVTPIAPQRFALHLSMGQSTHDKLRYAQELLSHSIPSGDIVELIDRALDLLIAKAEKSKFAATDRPRRSQRRSTGKRHIPDHVKRAVWARDQGAMHVRERIRSPLPSAAIPRVRSRRRSRAWRPSHGRAHAAALSRTQSVHRGAHVRRRLHGEQAGRGSASRGGTIRSGARGGKRTRRAR